MVHSGRRWVAPYGRLCLVQVGWRLWIIIGRTVTDGDDLVESRLVPWWPHQPRRRRRKRPVLVEIEVSRLAVEL